MKDLTSDECQLQYVACSGHRLHVYGTAYVILHEKGWKVIKMLKNLLL